MSRLGTICTAMITPFDEHGDLDSKEAARVARWLVERGNDGLVVAGTTGEGATLDLRERRELFGRGQRCHRRRRGDDRKRRNQRRALDDSCR